MSGKVKERVSTRPHGEQCPHYWVIEVANGPVSQGKCKYCGAKKDFYNTFPDFNPLRKTTNPFKFPGLDEAKKDDESLVSG